MGHFGAAPIRRAWLWFVMPALVAQLLRAGRAAARRSGRDQEPVLPAGAAVGAHSARDPRDLRGGDRLAGGDLGRVLADARGDPDGLLPAPQDPAHLRARRSARSTCRSSTGRCSSPWSLLVLGFRSSDNLGGAYGIAVTLAMLIDSVLIFVVMRRIWGWSRAGRAAPSRCRCCAIDLAFLASNSLKIPERRLVPAADRRRRVHAAHDLEARPRAADGAAGRGLDAARPLHREHRGEPADARAGHRGVPDVDRRPRAARAAAQPEAQQGAARARRVPHDPHAGHSARAGRRSAIAIRDLGCAFWRSMRTTASPRIPTCRSSSRRCGKHGLRVRHDGHVVLRLARDADPGGRARAWRCWRERLFVSMSKMAVKATDFFHIPTNRVVELGTQVEL